MINELESCPHSKNYLISATSSTNTNKYETTDYCNIDDGFCSDYIMTSQFRRRPLKGPHNLALRRKHKLKIYRFLKTNCLKPSVCWLYALESVTLQSLNAMEAHLTWFSYVLFGQNGALIHTRQSVRPRQYCKKK